MLRTEQSGMLRHWGASGKLGTHLSESKVSKKKKLSGGQTGGATLEASKSKHIQTVRRACGEPAEKKARGGVQRSGELVKKRLLTRQSK